MNQKSGKSITNTTFFQNVSELKVLQMNQLISKVISCERRQTKYKT